MASYLDACIHCGQCAQACHFHEVTKDPKYTPALKMEPIRKVYKRHMAPLSGVKRMIGLVPAELSAEDLTEWQELLYDSCTMCGRCTEVCPMGIDIASIVGLSRQAMVAAGVGPEDLMEAAENARTKGSPLGMTSGGASLIGLSGSPTTTRSKSRSTAKKPTCWSPCLRSR